LSGIAAFRVLLRGISVGGGDMARDRIAVDIARDQRESDGRRAAKAG
jgi:hypothetical protein